MAEDRLLKRAQRGDVAALEELCEREWRPVYSVVYQAVRDRHEAQDLTQEVFLRALKSLDRYQHTGAPFSAYLATIARNMVRDRWRRRQPVTVGLDVELEASHLFENVYEAQRQVGGTDTSDLFHVDMDHGRVVSAMFAGRSARHLPSDPIDEDAALAISEHQLWMWVPRFEEMSVFESSSNSFTGIGDRQDRIFSVSWAIQDDETGAWIPPRAMFQINMETGQVVFFSQSLETYEHSTVPTITAEQAEAIALDHAAETFGNDVAYSVERIDLAGLEDSMLTTSSLVWQVIVVPDRSLIMVDAHTGDMLDWTGEEIE